MNEWINRFLFKAAWAPFMYCSTGILNLKKKKFHTSKSDNHTLVTQQLMCMTANHQIGNLHLRILGLLYAKHITSQNTR